MPYTPQKVSIPRSVASRDPARKEDVMVCPSRAVRPLSVLAVFSILLWFGCASEDPAQTDVLSELEAGAQDAGITPASDGPVIQIAAQINGQEADAPPGPSIVVGDAVDWSCTVTNNDVAALSAVAVTAEGLGPVTCPKTELQPAESMTCTASGPAVAGQQEISGEVTATDAAGEPVEASDKAYYFGVAQGQLACSAGGPYAIECQGTSATIELDGAVTSAPPGSNLTFVWTTDCPSGAFDNPAIATPVLTFDVSTGCSQECKVTLTVEDGTSAPTVCEATVTVADTTKPVFDVEPEDLTLDCDDADKEAQIEAWLAAVTATDACGGVTMAHDLTAIPDACGGPVTVTWTATDACGNSATTSAKLEVVDGEAPVFDAVPEDLTLDCLATDKEAQVEAWLASVTATDNCGDATVENDFTAIPGVCEEPVTVTWTATDACGLVATVSAKLAVTDTIAPVITLNGEAAVTLECHIDRYVEQGAAVSDQCDTDLLEATVGGDVVNVDTPGTYVVTYDAVDACGNAAAQVARTVEVVDTTPPVITVGDPLELWPPNHKYAEFKLSDLVSIEDACEGLLDVDAVGEIVSIYSDEPEDAKGNGDGNTTDDIVILGPTTFQVRAEREGTGNGRVYGISFVVTDAAGNQTTGTAFVQVPHDQSGDAAVDDGPGAGYTVTP